MFTHQNIPNFLPDLWLTAFGDAFNEFTEGYYDNDNVEKINENYNKKIPPTKFVLSGGR